MNKNGSVLTLTLVFVLVFLLLGLAIIHYAGLQLTAAEDREASLEAFWLADGAVAMAFGKLKNNTTDTILGSAIFSGLGRGIYDVYSYADSCPPTCAVNDMVGGVCPCVSWAIKSYGTVNDQSRAIYAKAGQDFGGYDIENAIETHGTINDLPKNAYTSPCSKTDKDPEIYGGCSEYSEFSFEKVFGLTTAEKEAFLAAPKYYYNDPANAGDVPIIGGLTKIDVVGNNCGLNINTASQIPQTDPDTDLPILDENGYPIAQGSFLYVDASACSNVSIGFNGNVVFRGIIWVVGEAAILGDSGIYGAVFVDGALDGSNDTDADGSSAIYYDPTAIYEAIEGTSLGSGGGGGSGSLAFVSWKEIMIGSDKSEYE
ncbi:MAG: hypothetical protein KAS92_08120 [Candidatus Omnitrophica bacterium]|nr:hypothetical protein [Candidatus Omnitrophota bacterium]